MIRAPCLVLLVVVSLGYALEPRAMFVRKSSASPGDFPKRGVSMQGRLSGDDRPKRDVSVQGLTEAEKSDIVARHNMHRGNASPSASNMVKLQWDDEIALDAQEWANTCIFEHNASEDRMTDEWPWVGQNLAMGSGFTMLRYVDFWNSEKIYYDYDSNSCTDVCGHYTQVVWADTKYIGCGWASCRRSDYLVCHYGPGGNYIGERPYESGTSCSNCPYGYAGGCESNICQMG